MKRTLIAAAAAGIMAISAVGAASADATIAPNENSKSRGSGVGQASSAVTGNGVVVSEQAQSGQRAELVQAILAAEGKGRNR